MTQGVIPQPASWPVGGCELATHWLTVEIGKGTPWREGGRGEALEGDRKGTGSREETTGGCRIKILSHVF